MTSISRRTNVHYLIALLLFSFYGIQVCPFLDSLSPLQLLLPILIVFSLQWGTRLLLEKQ
ncbi:hypothetical protein [Aliamphritea spongicola]|nr:hypothetical protein [Aliamphritea spongicola]